MKCLAVVLVILLGVQVAVADASVPFLLNHQGMLTDDAGTPLTGTYTMTFKLYSVEAGGDSLWSETQTVGVSDGIFNVYLGDVTPLDPMLFTGQTLYLGITVLPDPEMSPRLRLASVPYAVTADQLAPMLRKWFRDTDTDTYGDIGVWQFAFSQPVGFVADSTDCDDGNGAVHPGAQERCDGVDNDCDPATQDGSQEVALGQPCDGPDSDGCEEGIIVCQGGSLSCTDDTGDDVEICDGIDNDCDLMVDEDVSCDDGDPCTTDQCTEMGCQHELMPGTCDDGVPCTTDQCTEMGCQHELMPGMCQIDGVCYSAGETNPTAECQECNPSVSEYTWTNKLDGTACSGGGTCMGGACMP